MDNINENNINFDLIARHLLGETTDNEQEAVKCEIAKNPEAWNELKKSFELSALASPVDTEAAWKKVQPKLIVNKEKEADISMFSSRKRIINIAAAIVLIAAVAYFLMPSKTNKSLNLASHNTELSTDLPDQSKVVLAAHSSLQYASNKHFRKVELTGKAEFKVARSEQKPFIINTQKGIVQVLGTQFIVDAIAKDSVYVKVIEGRVRVKNQNLSDSVDLAIGDEISIVNNQLKTALINQENKHFIFEEVALNEVFKRLSKEFNTNFTVKDSVANKLLITATFKNETLDEILDIVALTHCLIITKNQNQYEVEGKGCN